MEPKITFENSEANAFSWVYDKEIDELVQRIVNDHAAGKNNEPISSKNINYFSEDCWNGDCVISDNTIEMVDDISHEFKSRSRGDHIYVCITEAKNKNCYDCCHFFMGEKNKIIEELHRILTFTKE